MNTSQVDNKKELNAYTPVFEDESGINHRTDIKINLDLYRSIDYSIKKSRCA
jgi:hypothetical protein